MPVRLRTLWWILPWMLAACAAGRNGGRSGSPEFTILGSPAEVWEAAIDAFQDLELPISPPQRESGVIATDWILLDDPEEFMDCDEEARAQEGRYNLHIRDTPAARGTAVSLTASYRAVDLQGIAIRCDSTGEMESRIRSRIERSVESMQDTR